MSSSKKNAARRMLLGITIVETAVGTLLATAVLMVASHLMLVWR